MNRAADTVSLLSITLCTLLLGALLGGMPLQAAQAAVTPAQAQFGGQCTEGLAEGKHVQTSCAVSWTDKDGKAYCFASEEAKKTFLANTAANLAKARDFFAASTTESTEKAMESFDHNDAEAVVKAYIETTVKANNGVFPLEDTLNGTQLKLAFDSIDFSRTIDGYGFFPDVTFHDQADAKKNYLIDFWVAPVGGVLKIQEVRIYKEPVQADGSWATVARSPIPWWWIPASEHPGHMANKRGWEVMSAVEQAALTDAAKNNGVFKLKDDKTGKELNLEFIDTHQPIRQLDENGHYFACTDFRVAGTTDQIYDIDFWVNDKDGKMTVEQAKVHKVPELKDGKWMQVPRYEWKDVGASHVVP
jgi:hypothetical protein